MFSRDNLDPPGRCARRQWIEHVSSWLFTVASLPLVATLVAARRACAEDKTLLRRGVRRVHPTCGVPAADYQHGARSPSLIVRSLPVTPLSTNDEPERKLAQIQATANWYASLSADESSQADAKLLVEDLQTESLANQAGITAREPAKVFEFPRRAFEIAHCSISDIVVVVFPDGSYRLSLRLDQNPASLSRDSARNQELHIKRNLFHVKLRLLQADRAGGESQTPWVDPQPVIKQAGKPVLAELKPIDTWVQREQPRFVTTSGSSPEVRALFPWIEQAECEFCVDYDALTGSGEGVVPDWQSLR